MKNLILLMLAAAAASGSAATLRRLPTVTVSEGASVEFKSETAVAIKSSNTAVASVTPPDGGHATVTGIKIGAVELTCEDTHGPFAIVPVLVVPGYWETLRQFFEDDPEITVSIGGDKVIVGGRTASPETLRRVEQSKSFDAARILSQVTYSTPSIAHLLQSYLAHVGHSNVTVTAVGNEICLAGRLYDRPAIQTVGMRATEFLKDFPGVRLNVDALQIVRQKIVLELEMLEYDVNQARNLGIQWPNAIDVEGSFNYGWDWSRKNTDNDTLNGTRKSEGNSTRTLNDQVNGQTAGGTRTVTGSDSDISTSESKGSSSLDNTLKSVLDKSNGQTMSSKASVTGVKATINLLKQNGVSKTLYKTSLATQSGEEAKFQNGGTIHRNTTGTFSTGDLKTIEYGFIIKARPQILDARNVILDLDLDNKQPLNYDPSASQNRDIDVARYQTKSKYMVSPGETIVMSGFNKIDESQKRESLPWLGRIPWLGEWLFGNTYTGTNTKEMLLVVKIDWAIEDASADAIRRRDAIKDRKAEAEVP